MMGAFCADFLLNVVGIGYWPALIIAPIVVGIFGIPGEIIEAGMPSQHRPFEDRDVDQAKKINHSPLDREGCPKIEGPREEQDWRAETRSCIESQHKRHRRKGIVVGIALDSHSEAGEAV